MQRFQCLPACWALERKHKAVRKYGTASTNTTRFDLSMLEEVCAEQISILGKNTDFVASAHLIEPREISPHLRQYLVGTQVIKQASVCWTSAEVKLESGATVRKDDVVLYRSSDAPCPYHCFLKVDGILAVLLSTCTFVDVNFERGAAKFQEEHAQHNMAIMRAEKLLCSVIYSKAANGQLTVLLPAHLCAL